MTENEFPTATVHTCPVCECVYTSPGDNAPVSGVSFDESPADLFCLRCEQDALAE